MTVLDSLGPVHSFGEASDLVLDYLQTAVPLSFWSVTRYEDDAQVYLAVRDTAYGLKPGDTARWSDTMCQFVVGGTAPTIAPDVDLVPQYATAGARATMAVGAYVGIPIVDADGEVFGTLCGIDPVPQPVELVNHAALLEIFTRLLSSILVTDRQRTQASRLAERLSAEAEIDPLTGLFNRRGWDRFLQLEQARCRRFGDAGWLVVLDLDHLKAVNDQYGHAAGDAHIQRAAQVLKDYIRTVKSWRLGGDEFGILAANLTAELAAVPVDRLTQALSAAGTPASIGTASFTIASGFDEAVRAADRVMYQRKRADRRWARQSRATAKCPEWGDPTNRVQRNWRSVKTPKRVVPPASAERWLEPTAPDGRPRRGTSRPRSTVLAGAACSDDHRVGRPAAARPVHTTVRRAGRRCC